MPTLNQTRPMVKADASSWPAWTDADRWELGPEPTPEPAPYEPTEDESRWQSEAAGGGCSPVELSPSEVAMEAGTLSAIAYWRDHLDPAIDDMPEQLA